MAFDPTPNQQAAKNRYPATEVGAGKRISEEWRDSMRWCGELGNKDGTWLIAGRRSGVWVPDTMDDAMRFARQSILRHEADWNANYSNLSFISKALRLARMDLATPLSAFDSDPWILNTPRGPIDLMVGSVRTDGDDDDDERQMFRLQTRVSPTRMDTPLWNRHLKTMTHGDENHIRYLQRLAGMSLVGSQTEKDQINPVLNGEGRNGKGAFLGVLMWVLGVDSGGYAVEAGTRLLTARDGAHPAEQIALVGKRFVVVEELKDMNAQLFKLLTGGGIHTARDIREKKQSYLRSWTFWFNNNGPLQWKDPTDGLWDRISVLYFGDGIVRADRIKGWEDQLRQEGPGILQWMLDGCRYWQEEGLSVPEVVEAEGQERRTDADPLVTFLEETYVRCPVAEEARVLASAFIERFTDWCKRSGEQPSGGRNKVYNELRNRHKLTLQEWGDGGKLHILNIKDRPLNVSEMGQYAGPPYPGSGN